MTVISWVNLNLKSVKFLFLLSIHPTSMAVQPGLCRTWSETPKTGFLVTRLNVLWIFCYSDLSSRVDTVKEENLKLKSENQVLGQYIENLMTASSVFQSTSPKSKKK